MAGGMRFVLLLLAVSCCLIAVHSKVEHNVIVNDDRDVIQLSEDFGFEGDPTIGNSKEDSKRCTETTIAGHLDITLSGVKVLVPSLPPSQSKGKVVTANYSRLAFVLVKAAEGVSLEQFAPGRVCKYLKNDPVKLGRPLFTFHDLPANMTYNPKWSDKEKSAWAQIKRRWQVKVCNGGVQALYFLNCEDQIAVSFKARVDTYNVVTEEGRRSFVSVGERELDEMYWVMFAMFAAATGVWGWLLFKSRDMVHTVHYLMLLLAVFRTLTLMCQAFESYFLEAYGTPDGWNVAYYIFTFFRGVMFFTVVVLIGTGWSYMKPFLGDKEKRILMVVVPLQIFANIAIIVTEEESPSVRDWLTWRDAFHLVDIVCCCAVLFPIVWSIKHLREAAKTDGKAARNLEKLTLFRQFYVMVVVYIYFTRIVVYLLKSTLTDYEWVSDAAEELATLAFYAWTGYNFRPHRENPYLKLEQEELEMN